MDRPSALAWVLGALVGLTLLVAGVSKLSRRTWVSEAAQLGVPAAVARSVPPAEVVLGAALVTGLAYPWCAWAAAALLVAFTVVLAVQLRGGAEVVCACFGALSRAPVSGRSVARNAALIAVAVVAAVSS